MFDFFNLFLSFNFLFGKIWPWNHFWNRDRIIKSNKTCCNVKNFDAVCTRKLFAVSLSPKFSFSRLCQLAVKQEKCERNFLKWPSARRRNKFSFRIYKEKHNCESLQNKLPTILQFMRSHDSSISKPWRCFV